MTQVLGRPSEGQNWLLSLNGGKDVVEVSAVSTSETFVRLQVGNNKFGFPRNAKGNIKIEVKARNSVALISEFNALVEAQDIPAPVIEAPIAELEMSATVRRLLNLGEVQLQELVALNKVGKITKRDLQLA